MPTRISLLVGILVIAGATGLASDLTYDAPFFPESPHDPRVPTPESLLGHPIGVRPALPGGIARCLAAWTASPRARLTEYARSHEGRP